MGFQSLMYVNFVIKKKYRVDDIAHKMDIATDTLYRYVRGENIIPPDRIIDLIKATRDFEYLDFFCDPVGCIAIPQEGGDLKNRDLKTIGIEIAINQGKLLETAEKAFENNIIDEVEFQKIYKASIETRRKAAEFVEKIKKEMTK